MYIYVYVYIYMYIYICIYVYIYILNGVQKGSQHQEMQTPMHGLAHFSCRSRNEMSQSQIDGKMLSTASVKSRPRLKGTNGVPQALPALQPYG